MIINSLIKIFERDLQKLKDEIISFPREEDLWLTPGIVNNSSGNLCLHVCGNLKHFVGAVLGNSGYQRKRELEFSLKNIPLAQLLTNIDETKSVVRTTLSNLNDSELSASYPINVFGEEMTTEYFLIHLTTHLSYHVGQINYLRRIITD